MIRVLTACTRELDDCEQAVREILGVLDLENRLLANSAALLFCHVEFIEFGVVEALCGRLPFDVLGCTSQGFALAGKADEIMLALVVLTSDDTNFAAGVSEPLESENEIGALYQKTLSSLLPPNVKPDLIFAMQPTMFYRWGNDVSAEALFQAAAGTPVFGSFALDMGLKEREPKTIFNGASYSNRMAVLLLSGPVQPRFFTALFPEKAVFSPDAVITGAEGNRLISINHNQAVSFVEKLGIMQGDFSNGPYVIPLIIDYGGGRRDVVLMERMDPSGAIICSRNVRVGGILNVGSITADYVLETTETLLQSVKEAGSAGASGLFIFSCSIRNVIVGEAMAEIEIIQRELGDFPSPYLFCYSGGELCPGNAGSGKMENRFLQYALIACLL